MSETTPRSSGPRLAAQSALDVMLTDAAVEQGSVGRFIQPVASAKVAAKLALHPNRVADRAWQQNWLLRRLLQSYLVTAETVDGLITDADLSWRTERQARFAANN